MMRVLHVGQALSQVPSPQPLSIPWTMCSI